MGCRIWAGDQSMACPYLMAKASAPRAAAVSKFGPRGLLGRRGLPVDTFCRGRDPGSQASGLQPASRAAHARQQRMLSLNGRHPSSEPDTARRRSLPAVGGHPPALGWIGNRQLSMSDQHKCTEARFRQITFKNENCYRKSSNCVLGSHRATPLTALRPRASCPG